MNARDTRSINGAVETIEYACLNRISPREIASYAETHLRKAGYQVLFGDVQNETTPSVTVRSGQHWLEVVANRVGGTTGYSVVSASSGNTVEPSLERCGDTTFLPHVDSCVVVDCSSKASEQVEMQTGPGDTESLRGFVLTWNYSCPKSTNAVQVIKSAESALRKSGYRVIFEDLEDTQNPNLTAQAGDRWLGIAAVNDSQANGYTVTAAKALAARPRTSVLAKSGRIDTHEADRQKAPAPIVTQAALSPATKPVIAPAVARVVEKVPPPQKNAIVSGPYLSPQPLKTVAAVLPEKLKRSIHGELLVDVAVDVDTTGAVTNARALTTGAKSVKLIASAAVEAAKQWQFQPGKLGEASVASQTTVQFRFLEEPRILLPPSLR